MKGAVVVGFAVTYAWVGFSLACAPDGVHEAGLGLGINLIAALTANVARHVAIGRGGGVDDV